MLKLLYTVILLTALLIPVSITSAGDVLRGPYDVQLELSHMPQLNEEVTLVASVTSSRDVDSAEMIFWTPDSESVNMVKGSKAIYCKFKKNEIKHFEWTLSFAKEGVIEMCVIAVIYLDGNILGNRERLFVRTYKDRIAEILDPVATNELRMKLQPPPKEDTVITPGTTKARTILRSPAEEDSLKARIERARKSRGRK